MGRTWAHTAAWGVLGSALPSWQLPSGWLISAHYNVLGEFKYLLVIIITTTMIIVKSKND